MLFTIDNRPVYARNGVWWKMVFPTEICVDEEHDWGFAGLFGRKLTEAEESFAASGEMREVGTSMLKEKVLFRSTVTGLRDCERPSDRQVQGMWEDFLTMMQTYLFAIQEQGWDAFVALRPRVVGTAAWYAYRMIRWHYPRGVR